MMAVIVVFHVLVCILLCLVILMQSGRGGGLTESFSAAESMFGAKTNVVLVKTTTVLASIFIVTCLSLAFFSSQSSKSLISEEMNKESMPKSTAAVPAGNTVLPATTAATPVPEAKTTGENANLPETQNQPAAEPAATANPQ